jgi:hypothetical protein
MKLVLLLCAFVASVAGDTPPVPPPPAASSSSSEHPVPVKAPPVVWAIASDKTPCDGQCYVKKFDLKTKAIENVKQLEGIINILSQESTSNGQTNFFLGCTESGDDEDGLKCKFGSTKAKWRCMSYDRESGELQLNQPLQLDGEMTRMVYDFQNSNAIVTTITEGKFTWNKYNCNTGEKVGFLSSIGTVSTEFHQGADWVSGYLYPQVDGTLYRVDLKTGDIAEVWKGFGDWRIFEMVAFNGNIIGRHQNLTSGEVKLVFVDISNQVAQYLTDGIGSKYPRWKSAHYIDTSEEGSFWVQQAHQNKIVVIDLNAAQLSGMVAYKQYLFCFLH